MDKTTAPSSSSGAFVDDNPGGGIVGTLIVAADQQAHQDEVYNSIVGASITPSAASNAQLRQAINRLIKERSREVGEIFAILDQRLPIEWSVANELTHFPALCLTNFAIKSDISDANWPDLVPYLRGIRTVFKDGLSGQITTPGVTAWAIVSNVVTLTFTNDADHIALLTALSEDQVIHGSFTNWRTITLAGTIGSITAGTYAITAISPASRTVSFSFTAANASGSGAFTVEFYTHRIAGSSTTARVFAAQGEALHGVNDANGYFVAGGLRRQGYFQGHEHDQYQPAGGAVVPGWAGGAGSTRGALGSNTQIGSPKTDGTNGTPRTAKETNSPALSVHLYIHGGRYVA